MYVHCWERAGLGDPGWSLRFVWWGFYFCNLDSLNTNVPLWMSRSHLNLLSPGLMVSNSDVSFPSTCPGTYLLSRSACDRGPGILALPLCQSQSCQVLKTLKISFKALLGCPSPADQACACCKSWEANGPRGSP